MLEVETLITTCLMVVKLEELGDMEELLQLCLQNP